MLGGQDLGRVRPEREVARHPGGEGGRSVRGVRGPGLGSGPLVSWSMVPIDGPPQGAGYWASPRGSHRGTKNSMARGIFMPAPPFCSSGLLETVPADVVGDVHGLVGAGVGAPAAREGAVLAPGAGGTSSSGAYSTVIVTRSSRTSHR